MTFVQSLVKSSKHVKSTDQSTMVVSSSQEHNSKRVAAKGKELASMIADSLQAMPSELRSRMMALKVFEPFMATSIKDKEFDSIGLTYKHMVALHNVIGTMSALQDKIANNPEHALVSEWKKALDMCEKSLTDMDALLALDYKFASGELSLDGCRDSLSQATAIPEADLRLVAALKTMGIELERDGKQWKPYKSPEGAKNVFTDEQINNLIIDYLNQPDNRSGVIAPDALFEAANRQAQQSVDTKGLSSVEKGILSNQASARSAKFSTTSLEYQVELLTSPAFINQNAKAMAVVQIYRSKAQELSSEEVAFDDAMAQEIAGSEIFDMVAFGKKPIETHLAAIEDIAKSNGERVADLESKYPDPNGVVRLYDSLISQLKASNNPDQAGLVARVEEAKRGLVMNANFQTGFMSSVIAESNAPFQDKLTELIGKDVSIGMGKDGGYKLMGKDAKGNAMASSTFDALMQRAQGKAAPNNGAATPNKGAPGNASASAEGITSYPNLTEFMLNSEGLFQSAELKDVGELLLNAPQRMTEFAIARQLMNNPNGPLFKGYQGFLQTNPGKSIEDYINTKFNFVDENGNKVKPVGYLDPEVLADAYAIESGAQLKEGDPQKVRIDTRQKEFDKQLVLLDLITTSMTPSEVKMFQSASEEEKKRLLESKCKPAQEQLANLEKDPKGFADALAKAKLRHEKDVLAQRVDITKALTLGDPKKVFEQYPWMKDTIENYYLGLQKGRDADREQVKPAVNNPGQEDKQSETKKEGKKEGSNKVPYKKLDPQPPNLDKYKKLMKPYSIKELKKHFVDPLIDALYNIKIDMDAYNARTAAGSMGANAGKPVQKPQVQTNEKGNEGVDQESAPKNLNAVSQDQPATQNPQEVASQTPGDALASTTEASIPPAKPTITQSQFEASIFQAGALMLSGVNDQNSSKNMVDLAVCMDFLASMRERSTGAMGKVNDQGQDFRDALRHIALDVCRKKEQYQDPEHGREAIMADFKAQAEAFGVDITEGRLISRVQKGFELLTPEIMDFMFSTISTQEKVGDEIRLYIGADPAYPVEALAACNNDDDRKKIMNDYVQSRVANKDEFQASAKLLESVIDGYVIDRDGVPNEKYDDKARMFSHNTVNSYDSVMIDNLTLEARQAFAAMNPEQKQKFANMTSEQRAEQVKIFQEWQKSLGAASQEVPIPDLDKYKKKLSMRPGLSVEGQEKLDMFRRALAAEAAVNEDDGMETQ